MVIPVPRGQTTVITFLQLPVAFIKLYSQQGVGPTSAKLHN